MKLTQTSLPRRSLAAAALAFFAVLAACSGRGKVKPDKPMPLREIASTLQVERAWHNAVGGAPKMRLALDAATDGTAVYIASPKGEFEGIDAATGRVKWKINVKAPLSAGPAVAIAGLPSDLVVAGGPKGDVIALDAATGKQRWRVHVASEVLAAPAVGSDVVIVRTVDGKLRALEARDGSQRWITDQQLPRLTLRGNAPPQILGDMVLAGFDNGRLIAVTLAGGTTLWDVAIGQARGSSELQRLIDVDSAAAVDGDDLFAVSYQGRVARISRETGQIIWTHDISSYRGLALNADGLFISTAEGAVVKLDRSTGAEEWKQEALLRRQLSAPVVVGTHVVVADLAGVVHWLNVGDGSFAARAKAGARVTMPLVTSGPLLLVTDDKGGVTAFRTRDSVAAKPAAPTKPSS